jgi:hypothetical protein
MIQVRLNSIRRALTRHRFLDSERIKNSSQMEEKKKEDNTSKSQGNTEKTTHCSIKAHPYQTLTILSVLMY